MILMRRLIALVMMALIALGLALVIGCGAKPETSSTPPPAEQPPAGSMMSDSTMMGSDSSSMGH